jgi:hypothetical protein
VGEIDACGKKSIDGENCGSEDWQEDQKENLF